MHYIVEIVIKIIILVFFQFLLQYSIDILSAIYYCIDKSKDNEQNKKPVAELPTKRQAPNKRRYKDMDKMYIGKFEWKNGSINDNIRKILKGLSIGYYNTFNGDVVTSGDNRKVEAEHKENDEYYVYILFA